MKNVHVLGTALLVMVTCMAKAAEPVSLAKALETKKVKFSARGKGVVKGVNETAHYGKCIEVTLENLKNVPITIMLEQGRILQAADSGTQNMLITRNAYFLLPPYTRVKKDVYAMCSEHHDDAPGDYSVFYEGTAAGEKLATLTKFIAANNYQDDAGQAAVWCVTDQQPVWEITSADPVRQKKIRAFVAHLTGMPENPQASKASAQTTGHYKTHVQFQFSLGAKTRVSLVLYNEAGTAVKNYYNHEWLAAGSYNQQYELSTVELPSGVYRLVFVMNGEQVYERKLWLGEAKPLEEL